MLENSVLQSCVLTINRLAQKHNSLLFTNHFQISFSTNFPVNKIRRPVNRRNIEGFLAEKILFTLASVLWMATLSYRHFLTIFGWPLDSSCSNKLGKVKKQFHWSVWILDDPILWHSAKLVSVSASERISCFIDSDGISTRDGRSLFCERFLIICNKSCISLRKEGIVYWMSQTVHFWIERLWLCGM